MISTLADPVTTLGGTPFLDDAFAFTRLLTIVAAVRHVDGERRSLANGLDDGQIEQWLTPARAYLLRGRSTPMPARPLTASHRQAATEACESVTAMLPPWGPLLQLPVRYAELYPTNGAISASSRDWPQHVLLADAAFSSPRELREQTIHELCHQWLYLLQEVWPLQVDGARTVTLPSGTANRDLSEVLGAAHVAAALIRMYRCGPAAEQARIDDLTSYGAACLALLHDKEDQLTEAGLQLARRLKEAL